MESALCTESLSPKCVDLVQSGQEYLRPRVAGRRSNTPGYPGSETTHQCKGHLPCCKVFLRAFVGYTYTLARVLGTLQFGNTNVYL